jgi:hypothetical protein
MTFASNAVVSAVVVGLSCVAIAAQTPGEVQDLRWCAGMARDCLGWTPVAGADSYRVHLGEDVSLYCVASASPDSSWRLVAGPPAPGAFPENPPAGRFF